MIVSSADMIVSSADLIVSSADMIVSSADMIVSSAGSTQLEKIILTLCIIMSLRSWRR
jgi:hypothetical protein